MLGWLTDVLKASVSLLTLHPGQFLTPGPAVQVLEARRCRAWRTLLSRQKGGCERKTQACPGSRDPGAAETIRISCLCQSCAARA